MAATRDRLPRLDVRQTMCLTRNGERVLSERHFAILEAVRAHGSLNAAAKHLGISFRDAWEKIRTAEAGLGVALLATQTGGRRGGGSRLTAAGEELLARLRAFQHEQRQAAARAAAVHFGGPALARATQTRPTRDCVRLATTTSVVDTGLLPLLLPAFTRRYGVAVDVEAVGSGRALDRARTGRADAVLTHAPEAEALALRRGIVVNPRAVMHNEFVIVGPAHDPARVRSARDVQTALRRIASTGACLLSRGDRSGTHQREQALLRAAGITPGAWYRSEGVGMAELLRRASNAGAYALADRGTVAALGAAIELDVLLHDGAALQNRYAVIATDPQHQRRANYFDAMALIAWLTSPAAQDIIAAYRVGGHPGARPVGRLSRSAPAKTLPEYP